ncbi:MAG: RtcB family protein [Candidatus Dojkabacteria bacterium]|jgi:tRNA-splicing ligase RtcB|nr:RtcB family protein [Candidatus Dojkabacteria bacterium]
MQQQNIPLPEFKKIDATTWEIPVSYKKGMRVPARIIATKKILDDMDMGVFEQVTNVATLPGIQKFSFCMPDGHWGYGFPVGGVAAFNLDEGVISPGGIGFDINCGMRIIRTNLTVKEVAPRIKDIVDRMFRDIPTGVGKKGIRIAREELMKVATDGAGWCLKNGYGWDEDLERIESQGCIADADPQFLSDSVIKRGMPQLGTLGSGNHYLEIQYIPKNGIFDKELANLLNLNEEQVLIMIHTGSRGFGHQVATDYLRKFDSAMRKYGITVPDRDLAYAPFKSPEGQEYFKSMNCAINYAFANRQIITHFIREVFMREFQGTAKSMEMELIYDVAHNTAKVEEYDGKRLIVHRKGSTRSFGPKNPEIPEIYQETGQPVIIGGSMETGSYLLAGTNEAEQETFGSTAHGSGRTMSRSAAKRKVHGKELEKNLAEKGIYVRSASYAGLAEEAGLAYKNVDDVCEAVELAGISKRVVKLLPLGNIKG